MHPLLDVIRGGSGRRLAPVDERERARLFDAEGTAGALHDPKLSSLVVVPIGPGDRVRGTLTVCFGDNGREHEPGDLTLAEDLARIAAFAIENVELRQQAHARACELVEERARQESGCRNFLGTLSHELRASLAAMLLWEKILRGASDEATRNRALDAIHQSTVAQSKMVEEITDLSRCVSGNLEIERSVVALDSVVEAAIQGTMAGGHRQGRRRSRPIPASRLGTVRGDATRLRQALEILLAHALSTTGAGGSIRVSGTRSDAHAHISVNDTGSGIAAARLPHIFAPFAASSRAGAARAGGPGPGAGGGGAAGRAPRRHGERRQRRRGARVDVHDHPAAGRRGGRPGVPGREPGGDPRPGTRAARAGAHGPNAQGTARAGRRRRAARARGDHHGAARRRLEGHHAPVRRPRPSRRCATDAGTRSSAISGCRERTDTA